MAPLKRSRAQDDVDGDVEVEVEVESASSQLRMSNHHQKRTKIALAQAQGGAVVSDDEEDDPENPFATDEFLNDDVEESKINNDASALHDSVLHEPSDSEQEEDEIDEIQATQYVQKQMRQLKQNVAAEMGVIKEVYCRNFMCHSKLRIRLGPLINFIVGHNGSGKSAVLTALQICLGNKASGTNRAKTLKAMIKTGCDSGMVGVKIKNEGDNAYKNELYGDTIIVERHFTKAGSSSYKLKSAEDRLITNKKADLDDLLDYFALQMDNPINVLTQDQSRQFLSNSTSHDKYKFFLRGTRLETLDSDYKLFEENLDKSDIKLRLYNDEVAELKRLYEAAEAKKKRADQNNLIHHRIRDTQRQHAWAQVESAEKLLKDIQEEEQKGEEAVTAAEQVAEEIDARYEAQETAKSAAQAAQQQHEASLVPVQDCLTAAKDAFKANTTKLLEKNTEERIIRENLKKVKREIKKLDDEITSETARLSGEHGDAHAKRQDQLRDLTRKAQEAKNAIDEHKLHLPDLEQRAADAQQLHEDTKPSLDAANDKVNEAKSRMSRLQSEQGNTWAPYHPRSQQLRQEIDKETRWRKKPVGPMGMYVRLLKPEWGSIVESTLGGSLSGYGVTCMDDQQMLNKIARRVGCPAVSFIANAAPLGTEGKEPEADVDTILRILKFDEDIVRNIVIINNIADQTVLIEGIEDGRAFMYPTNGPRPKNVRATLTMSRDSKGRGQRWEYSRAGAEKVGPVREWNGPSRMKADRQQEVQIQRERVQDAQRRLGEAESNLRHLRDEETKAKQAVELHKRESRKLQTAWQKAEDAVEAKQSEIDSNRPQDGKLQELERLKAASVEEKETTEGAFEDVSEQKAVLNDAARELKFAVDKAQEEVDKINNYISDAKARFDQCEMSRVDTLDEKNKAHDDVEFEEKKLQQTRTQVEGQQTVVAEWTAEASKLCERVPVNSGDTPEILEARSHRLQGEYAAAQRAIGGNVVQLTTAWQDARTKYVQGKGNQKQQIKLNKVSRVLECVIGLARMCTDKQLDAEIDVTRATPPLGIVSKVHLRPNAHSVQLSPC